MCPVCFLLPWVSSPARLMSWTTAAALRGDHTLQGRGTQKGISKPGIPTKFLTWNCSLSKAGEKISVSSLKKKKNPTNRENCFAEESTGGRGENKPKKPSKQTPTQPKSFFIRKSWRSVFFSLTQQCGLGRFGKICKAGGGENEENKQHQWVPREYWAQYSKALPHLGSSRRMWCLWLWREESSPRVSDPGIPVCSPCSQGLFLLAPSKEGFPGVAQSVTFVCFLWSTLLNYFLSKRPRNLIGEMRSRVWSGRIIMKNCHFPDCSFVSSPAFWDKDTAAGLDSILKGHFGCLIIYEI